MEIADKSIINKDTKFLIVGLGLLGGSYALALKKKGYRVGAIDVDGTAIEYALNRGIIDEGKTCVEKEFVESFDVAVFALYPSTLVNWIENYGSLFKGGTILTDVTGVKEAIVYKIQNSLKKDVEFIGAHPMAGKECSSVFNASAELFKGANYIVTPTNNNTNRAILTCEEIGKIIDSGHIARLSPKSHDEMVGFLSQLTHVIAISLMTCKDPTNLKDYTGDSFRDLTRIAKINENMWSELFFANKETLLEQMDLFLQKFNAIKKDVENDDLESLKEIMRLSTKYRKLFDKE